MVLVDVGPRSREADCDIRSEEVAVYHPEGSLAVRTDDRGRAIEAMAEAFSRFLARQPDVAGVIGLGLDFAQAFPFADGGKLLGRGKAPLSACEG
ncbi:MAG: Tm-1-like ATP-binding domain-containing protein [Verrucomicrobia bacterium]|nr:Tm-1-like ATP-binding domain-containing protein [Verrucomicrobiota bacterium]